MSRPRPYPIFRGQGKGRGQWSSRQSPRPRLGCFKQRGVDKSHDSACSLACMRPTTFYCVPIFDGSLWLVGSGLRRLALLLTMILRENKDVVMPVRKHEMRTCNHFPWNPALNRYAYSTFEKLPNSLVNNNFLVAWHSLASRFKAGFNGKWLHGRVFA